VHREPLREVALQTTLKGVVDVLYDLFAHYSWVGIYVLERQQLVLHAWRGPQATEHLRIPITEGICGSAARSGRTEIVGDVSVDKRYLVCFPSTRSEIVVPVKKEGRVVGEIDIDSDQKSAFGERDRTFLERVAGILADRWQDLTLSSHAREEGGHDESHRQMG